MAKKKDVQEELMKTHVLNLNEIREAEKKDKIEKKKKNTHCLTYFGYYSNYYRNFIFNLFNA